MKDLFSSVKTVKKYKNHEFGIEDERKGPDLTIYTVVWANETRNSWEEIVAYTRRECYEVMREKIDNGWL